MCKNLSKSFKSLSAISDFYHGSSGGPAHESHKIHTCASMHFGRLQHAIVEVKNAFLQSETQGDKRNEKAFKDTFIPKTLIKSLPLRGSDL